MRARVTHSLAGAAGPRAGFLDQRDQFAVAAQVVQRRVEGQVDLVLFQQRAVLQQLGEALGQRAQRAHALVTLGIRSAAAPVSSRMRMSRICPCTSGSMAYTW